MRVKTRAHIYILFVYIATIVFYIVLELAGGRENKATYNYIGLSMLIPLFVVIFNETIVFNQHDSSLYKIPFHINKWILIALVLPILMALILHGMGESLGYGGVYSKQSYGLAILIGVTIASVSALAEEVVWRGYLVNLLEPIGRYKSVIIISFLWALWHIPVTMLYKYPNDVLQGVVMNSLQMFGFSIIITYLKQASNSIIPPTLMHGLMNTLLLSRGVLDNYDFVFLKIMLCVVIVVIIITKELQKKKINRRILE